MAAESQPFWKRFLLRLGHVQAQIILFLLFWLILTPYALLLRLCGCRFLPEGGWRKVENKADLQSLRRMF